MERQEKIIDRAYQLVQDIFANDCTGHDYYHTKRVVTLAESIAKVEGGNLFIIRLAALLHDVDDSKLFHTSEELSHAHQFCKENEVTKEEEELICEIIQSVSFHSGQVPSTIEGKIVQDADRLDAIGAIGIARAFAYGGSKKRAMYDPEVPPNLTMSSKEYHQNVGTTVNHFYEKLLKLKEMMNTKEGLRLATQRHEFMEMFLKQFYDEWEGVK